MLLMEVIKYLLQFLTEIPSLLSSLGGKCNSFSLIFRAEWNACAHFKLLTHVKSLNMKNQIKESLFDLNLSSNNLK